MKMKFNDFWLIKNNTAANTYMDEVAKESNFTGCHKGYTILPHKIHRCYGLNVYEKLILVDIIAYMSDKSQCYPTMEMIARNVGCSSKTVERHIESLAEKKLILVSQSKNNTYYLPNYLQLE
ncbi:helix-turn-helix domain-containing protein [Paenibacillus albicereus]|uniref:Helix-turn-helix domain-containing protein n=1 Tax=Paenibacillus albicereus TaxID=2726185 RepID=A0A6H2GYR4_9BACL|nr:helix-turn-helix domain-containing protein [Paenibacillus albicereus]QJC52574.1 helix-turn-helix domain-containing protein [Paenibacillus albicereus]